MRSMIWLLFSIFMMLSCGEGGSGDGTGSTYVPSSGTTVLEVGECQLVVSSVWDGYVEYSFGRRELRGLSSIGQIPSSLCDGENDTIRLAFAISDGDSQPIRDGDVVCTPEDMNTDFLYTPGCTDDWDRISLLENCLMEEEDVAAIQTPDFFDEVEQITECECPTLLSLEGPDRNFSEENIEAEGFVFYPLPEIECVNDDECGPPFSCIGINPSRPDSPTSCGIQLSDSTVSDLEYQEASLEPSMIFMMDHGESLEGRDEDGNYSRECSTDPLDKRITAGQSALLKIWQILLADNDQPFEFCVGSFNGEAISFLPSVEECFVSLEDEDGTGLDSQAISRLSELTLGEQGNTPTWDALVDAVSLIETRSASGSIVMFVDGPDNGSISETAESALEAVVQSGIEMNVIQLDSPHPEQELMCSETEHYGPLQELIHLGCESGGIFQYVLHPDSLRPAFNNISYTQSDQLIAEITLPEIPSLDLPAGAYLVSTTLTVTLNEQVGSYLFSGEITDASSGDIIDTRFLHFIE